MFCPTCRSELFERALPDPHLRGYACRHGDVFYMPLVGEIGGIPEAATVSPPPLDDDIAILKFWLTDRHARRRVPDQLAVACRRLIELAEQGRRIGRRDIFLACLTCAGPLRSEASGDQYMQLLRCDRGHEFWWRGDALTWTDDGVRRHLAADPDDRTLLTLIDYYSGDHPLIQPYVHPQLRSALRRLSTTLRFLRDQHPRTRPRHLRRHHSRPGRHAEQPCPGSS